MYGLVAFRGFLRRPENVKFENYNSQSSNVVFRLDTVPIDDEALVLPVRKVFTQLKSQTWPDQI